MDSELVATLTSIFALFSTTVAIWATVSRRREETKQNEAGLVKTRVEAQDIVADTAREWIDILNKRAAEEADARLQSEVRANRLEEKVVALEESRAGLAHENQWLREGAQRLIHQIMALDQIPVWNVTQTKPMLTTWQVERMIQDLLEENGSAQKMKGDKVTR